ncbi:hypothetical protein Anas_11294 [Armadillidium nasatum]|uniref:Uncharacterized protein n=1 Tax=Armadillidium nasatum TaxID=96803 RepID=A0A5N5TGX4_9CRUS|nr:hypothetical protein Anas_11294 [Armadillidium nasatum]
MEESKIIEKENVKATQIKTEEKTETNLEKKTEILMETNLKNKNTNLKEPKMSGTPEKETTKNYLQTWDETHFGKMAILF